MSSALRICLSILGLAAVGIALSIWVLGAATTAGTAEAMFRLLTHRSDPASGAWPPTMDSELRFYAALWGAYGVVVLRTAWGPAAGAARVPWLAAVFFAGGVGRVLSFLAFGPPHPVFTLLMAIELVLPVMLMALWWPSRRRA